MSVVSFADQVDPQLTMAMAERTTANINGDVASIENLMTDDYVQTDISGHVQTKSEWLEQYFKPVAQLIKDKKFHWTSFHENDVQIHVYQDTAIVVGNLSLEGVGATFKGGEGWVAAPDAHVGPSVLCFTRVWLHQNGEWKLAAIHNSLHP